MLMAADGASLIRPTVVLVKLLIDLLK